MSKQMVQGHRVRRVILLLATLIISFPQFMSAQVQLNKTESATAIVNSTAPVSNQTHNSTGFGSTQTLNSTAYLSSSWTNKPSRRVNNSDLDTFSPILLRGSDGPRFICGFYCDVNNSTCRFGVLIFQNKIPPEEERMLLLQFPQLVWSANRDNPVRTDATLQLRQDGNLVLADSDGTLVWSSNTRGKSVAGLNLTEMGNLVLFGRNNETIWQSFDHPTDSLLPGQKMVPGQNLIASVSATNWSQGLFTLSVGDNGFSAYVNSNPPQKYYASFGFYEFPYLQFENGSFNGWQFPYASAAQFMKFGPDGHLKVYMFGGVDWSEIADLLPIDAGDCGYPMVCGRYGVCSSGQCACPETNYQARFFRQINFRQPDLGCSLVTPISCSNSKYHSLLELKNANYFTFNSSLYGERIELEDCKMTCLSNCSCRAVLFLYRRKSGSKGGCLLLNEVFSIMDSESVRVSGANTSLFVKVQNSVQNSVHKVTPTLALVLAFSIGGFIGLLLITVACVLFFWKRSNEKKEIGGDIFDLVPGMPTRYSYENLKAMTENFSRKLGQGGFGFVYEGTLENGTKVAVKCLDDVGQVKDSFLVEVNTIGCIHHVNLVKLVGFCTEESHRLLVYEYMANGSLDTWIFSGKKDIPLQWHTRRKIVLDIAKGLAYLHGECSQKIIHFDIKPQNILLDENLNAKVSDFGLSKLIEKDQSRVVTRMRGTPGYLAPEWLSSIITEKVDVYSFGIVILEIICGRKNVDWTRAEEDRHLLSVFKRKAEEEKLWDMVDNNCDDIQIHREEAEEMMRIAAWCLQGDFNKRPSMSLVVKVLEGLVAVETNLDYEFTNSSAFRTVATPNLKQEFLDVASPLLPSTLSGPR